MKIGIIGAGAMGSLFGYHLAQRCTVTMLDDDAEVAAAVSRNGLRVNDEPVRAVQIAERARDLYDSQMLFLFVKAVDTLRALRAFAGELDPVTPVISLQNGVGNEDAIKTALGGAVPVILGITTESSHTIEPGRVSSSRTGHTIIGSTSASWSIARHVTDVLTGTGLRATVVHDIRPHLWGKLVVNAAINALSAILDCEAGEIPRDANAARLAEGLADETAERGRGAEYQFAIRQSVAIRDGSRRDRCRREKLDGLRSPFGSSERDRSHQRCGRRVRTARRFATPYNEAMVRLVKAKEELRRSRLRL